MSRQPQTSGNLALEQKKVIVIEAAPKPEAARLRVAAYCRVSSDSTDQLNSFVAQLNCQRRCDFVVFRRTWNVEKWRVYVYSL